MTVAKAYGNTIIARDDVSPDAICVSVGLVVQSIFDRSVEQSRPLDWNTTEVSVARDGVGNMVVTATVGYIPRIHAYQGVMDGPPPWNCTECGAPSEDHEVQS